MSKSMRIFLSLVSTLVISVRSSQGLDCGFPGVPLNGSVTGSGVVYYPGESVTYTCQAGFVLFGPSSRNCTDDGTWTNTVPECKQNLALGKPALQSSTLWNYDSKLAVDGDPNSCSFTTRSSEQRWWQVQLGINVVVQSVVITITPGSFQKFTIFIIELLEGNKAMYKPCSKFVGNFDTKKAVFLCNDGMGHPGQFVYIRDEREEPEYLGLCEVEVFQLQNETECGQPERPVSSLVEHIAKNVIEYSCLKGFRLLGGNDTRECTKPGVWSGKPPRCIEVQCTDPLSVKDGFIEVSNFKGKYIYGSLATYHCNPGYILWGNASRLCSDNGDWTGVRPECKPITCGLPPEYPNAKYELINATTSWKSIAAYKCKNSFKMVVPNRNSSDVWSVCGESGLWQEVSFNCIFDPLAVNLKQGSKIFEELAIFGEDGFLNFGTLATVVVLGTLVLLVVIVVILFFNQRRKTEVSERKISRSSTNQLIADVANGLAAHFEGPNPPDEKITESATTFINGEVSNHYVAPEACSAYNNNHNNILIQMSSSPQRFSSDGQGSIVEIKDWNLLEQNHQTAQQQSDHLPYFEVAMTSQNSSDIGKRSSGDGDSSIEDYGGKFKNSKPGEEENQMVMSRRPDGRTDDNIYSTLRETRLSIANDPLPEGDDVQIQLNSSDPNIMLMKTGALNQEELMSLYAQVDKNRLTKNIHYNFSGGKNIPEGTKMNVYANVMPKLNFRDDSVLMSGGSYSGSSTTPRQRLYRPTTLQYNTYKPPGSRPVLPREQSENNYATIGSSSKRLVPHLKTANV